MKRLLFVVPFLLIGCTGPKLHYNDCVMVDDEFYGPTYGLVTKYDGFNGYTVDRRIDNVTSEWFINGQLLTKVSDSYCSNNNAN